MMICHFLEISTDHKQNVYKRSSFQYLKLNLSLTLASLTSETLTSLTTEKNLKIVKFLEVTLNLNTRTHKPYNKPNNNPLYTKRISKLSSSTSIFNNCKDLYKNALSASGFQQRIKFKQGNTSATPNKNRKRNII